MSHEIPGLQNFGEYGRLNPVEITIDSNKIIETLTNYKKYCCFSYAGNWELVKSIVGTKFRRSHVCLHSQAGNRL